MVTLGSLRTLTRHGKTLFKVFTLNNVSLARPFHLTATNNMPTALLFLAEGAEEMEVVITADILRRGGIDVTVAGVPGKDPIVCVQNVKIVPDKSLADALKAGPYDAMVCPGGAKGAEILTKSAEVGKALQDQEKSGKTIAAVCAGPTILQAHGVGKGKKATSHPLVKDKCAGYFSYQESRVVVDGKIITSRSPGTCFEFALAIVEQLVDKAKAQSLMEPMLIKM